MPISLEGQVCLITGASAGIGEACAKLFAKEKCTLILLARREDRLRAVKGKILETCNVCFAYLALYAVRGISGSG